MNKEDIVDNVAKKISEMNGGVPLLANDDIFRVGKITSLKALILIQWLESFFSISVIGPDLRLENFGSISLIADFVENKLSREQSGVDTDAVHAQ